MQTIRQIERLNALELQKCIPPNASWHTDYRDTAYIHIGGLPFELSEGDVLTIFSQYGNPVHIHLARDKETGKSRGFAFLKYEDQRSCDLAVDNLSGAGVLGRVLGVDHCRYKLKEGEVEGEGMEESAVEDGGDETDREGEGRRKRRRRSESGSGEEEERPRIREEVELEKLLKEHDEDDPMREYMVQQKKEEVAEALKRLEVSRKDGKRDGERKRRHHRSRRHGSEGEDGERRRETHRSRREREGDDERRNGHRSRRSKDVDDREEKYRSRRDEEGEERTGDHRKSRRDDASSDDEFARKRESRRSTRDASREGDSSRRGGRDRSRREDSREDETHRRRD